MQDVPQTSAKERNISEKVLFAGLLIPPQKKEKGICELLQAST